MIFNWLCQHSSTVPNKNIILNCIAEHQFLTKNHFSCIAFYLFLFAFLSISFAIFGLNIFHFINSDLMNHLFKNSIRIRNLFHSLSYVHENCQEYCLNWKINWTHSTLWKCRGILFIRALRWKMMPTIMKCSLWNHVADVTNMTEH